MGTREEKSQGPPATLGATAFKPVGWDRTGCEALRYFLYDPDNGTFLSRTPLSWLKIILFYIIYYCLLALFWMACLQIFFLTLHDDRPKWTLEESVIGVNPGIGVRPRVPDQHIGSSLYVLAAGSEDEVPSDDILNGQKNIDYAVRLSKFYERYSDTDGLMDCSLEPNEAKENNNCTFDLSLLEECAEYPYGYLVDLNYYNYVQPCFVIKLNKILDWVPTAINRTEIDDEKYSAMSDNLRNKIKKSMDINYVWIDCKGRYPADRESVRFDYFPSNQGISLKHFPYQGEPYHQPLVAIKVHQTLGGMSERPAFGQLLHLECRAWYQGVKHSVKDKSGLTLFDLVLEPKREL